jgi:NitT/TauT family transport system ATP-binding protein
VLVMTSVPGRIKDVLSVGITRPRDIEVENTPEFLALKTKIWNSIRLEVERSMTGDHDDA